MPLPDILAPSDRPADWALPALPYLRRDVAVVAGPRRRLLIAGSARHLVQVLSPPTGLAAWLVALDGTADVAEAVQAGPLPEEQGRHLLAELDRAGLLADANEGRAFSDPDAGQRDALRLANRARDGGLPPARAVAPLTVAVDGVAPLSGALRSALRECPEQVRLSDAADAALVVSVSSPFGGSSAAAGRALASGAAHVAVVVSAFDALLSPVAIAGRTACVRCWELRTDARQMDWADWIPGGRLPRAPQLPAHQRSLVTALAVEHILSGVAVLQQTALGELAATERCLDLRAGTVTIRQVDPHPACGCFRLAAA